MELMRIVQTLLTSAFVQAQSSFAGNGLWLTHRDSNNLISFMNIRVTRRVMRSVAALEHFACFSADRKPFLIRFMLNVDFTIRHSSIYIQCRDFLRMIPHASQWWEQGSRTYRMAVVYKYKCGSNVCGHASYTMYASLHCTCGTWFFIERINGAKVLFCPYIIVFSHFNYNWLCLLCAQSTT